MIESSFKIFLFQKSHRFTESFVNCATEILQSSTLYAAIYKAISGNTVKTQANILELIDVEIQSQKQMWYKTKN